MILGNTGKGARREGQKEEQATQRSDFKPSALILQGSSEMQGDHILKTAPGERTFAGTVEPTGRPPSIYLKVLALEAKAHQRRRRGALDIVKGVRGELGGGITCLHSH